VSGGFAEIVLATGVTPRVPAIEGLAHRRTMSYIDAIRGTRTVGHSVAIVGAGGIGFDVAELLSHDGSHADGDVPAFLREWGVDMTLQGRGGLLQDGAHPERAPREIFLLQRRESKPGEGLGKTTGWIHRTALRRRGVQMLSGVTYGRIDDAGFHVTVGGAPRLLNVDNVVICAGQEPLRELLQPLRAAGLRPHLIGGADVAVELDAKRAIDQGCRVGAAL
jgi:2,4-dienoyl-CoA reductase (NADPH2)